LPSPPPPADGDRVPLWVVALGTTLGIQTVASFLSQSLPIVAPLLTAHAGLSPERIGYMSSLISLGSVLFFLFGGPVLARLGPVRMLQAGMVLTCGGLALVSVGWWPALVLAALVMGIGYGPSAPAGSRILAATAPSGHRTLIFSIKQAGAPLGGALAGLVLAPVAGAAGWGGAVALAVALGLVAVLIVTPARAKLDREREPGRPIGPKALFDPRKVAAPFQMLQGDPVLLAITGLAFSFAMVQGSLFSFTVTYLTTDRHLPLAAAGIAYAALQLAGVVARIFLGWLADRTGSPALNLTVQAFVAAAAVVVFGALPVGVDLATAALLGAVTGFVAASWNGIYLAEVARLAPPEHIADVTSSSSVVVFLGYVTGPSLFSITVTASGGYRLPFFVIAGQLGLMALAQAVILTAARRRSI
jgi:MFS family permease